MDRTTPHAQTAAANPFKEIDMAANFISSLSLRTLLAVDAATCVLMGAALSAAPQALGDALGLPPAFVGWAGLLLFPCALLMLATALPRATPPALAWLVVIGNAAWVIASVLVATLVFTPTALGVAFVLAQALAVALIAALEYRALPRRATAAHYA